MAGKVFKRMSEIMDKIYEKSVWSGNKEDALAKLLKKYFEDCYKKAANELDNPDEEIPSPTQIAHYIEELPDTEQEKAITIANVWFDGLEN